MTRPGLGRTVRAAGTAIVSLLALPAMARVTGAVTFSPDGGAPNQESAPVKLVRRK